jgi:hypothetical protein
MKFCEDCRINQNWPRAVGFPYTGVAFGNCELCSKRADLHDVPGSKLVPDTQKTTEEKLVDKIMNEGYKDKAESLVITYSSGQLNHRDTEMLRQIIVKKNDKIDWHATYNLRLVAVEGFRRREEFKNRSRQ